MSAHVLLNLLNELMIKKRDSTEHLLLNRNKFNKFNDTGAQMLDLFIISQ